jgi:hypothetical protein
MAGLVPAIHAAPQPTALEQRNSHFLQAFDAGVLSTAWIPGTSPGMTAAAARDVNHLRS